MLYGTALLRLVLRASPHPAAPGTAGQHLRPCPAALSLPGAQVRTCRGPETSICGGFLEGIESRREEEEE